MLLREGTVAQRAQAPHAHTFSQPSTTCRLIFVTNRGPVEYAAGPNGVPEAHRGAGGVVSGLIDAVDGVTGGQDDQRVSWISLAMTEADRALAQPRGSVKLHAPTGLKNLTSRLVYVPEDEYALYYEVVCNRLLWFTQHGMSLPTASLGDLDAAWQAYVAVNRAVADAVIEELRLHGEETPVQFHDYHLYLAARMVREAFPDARLQQFVHIPWPSPEGWARMPHAILRQIFDGLLGNDVVGFQTPADARNFCDGARVALPDAFVSMPTREVRRRGERTWVRAYPIAVTPENVRAEAHGEEAEEQARLLREQMRLDEGRKLIVRVDRVEPAKNIVEGFRAFDQMLREHEHWRERVSFLALLVPSRESVPEYQAYAEEVDQIVAEINERWGTETWQPIVAVFGNDRARALACMRYYDVLLVNSLADGMNLVVKEGGLVNEHDGAIVLSKRAGAYVQLHGGVLGIDPMDTTATAQALYLALTMPQPRRAALASFVRRLLEQEDAESWLSRQLDDLAAATGDLAEPAMASSAPHTTTWSLDMPPVGIRRPIPTPAHAGSIPADSSTVRASYRSPATPSGSSRIGERLPTMPGRKLDTLERPDR